MNNNQLTIGNDQLPEGYKQTEVGIIPEDWNVKQLRTALRTSPQYGINAASVAYQGGLPTYIRITDISEDGYFKPEKLVSVKHSSASQYFLEEGDLVFARTGASVGKSYLYRPQDGRLVYAGFLIKVQPDKTILLPSFLSQYVNTKAYWNWVQLMSMRSGQPGINGNEYGQLLLPVPKLEEQRSIAQALSNVDALIAALVKLIAKKCYLKIATMQQLLTGKKRLPGFGEGKGYQKTEIGVIPEDWETCRLGEAVDFLDGKRKPIRESERAKMRGIYPYFGASGIVDYVNDYLFDEDLILLGEDGENILSRSTRLAFRVSGKIWVNNHAHVLRPKSSFDIGFLSEYLENLDYSLHNSGTAQPKLNQQTCQRIAIVQPSEKEQRAIATVLSEMDAEIAALETRLAKTQAIKQGMMQQLLTGKVRLKIEG